MMKKNKYVLIHPPDRFDGTDHSVKALKHKRVLNLKGIERQTIITGIWDLGAWLGMLPEFVNELNSAQDIFIFFEIKAPVPSGLISRPKGMVKWLTERLGQRPEEDKILEIKNNLIADDFFKISETIRNDLNIDYILGITPSMVAGVDGDKIYWNHFSSFSKQSILASSYGLREYSNETGIELSAFLISIILPQLLTAIYWPKLGFHPDRGCLFDHDNERVRIKHKAKKFFIEKNCLDIIEEPYREGVMDLLAYFKKKKGE